MQDKDTNLRDFFKPIAEELENKQDIIRAEYINTQGNKVDLGGYYKFDDFKCNAIMRPSTTFNAILDKNLSIIYSNKKGLEYQSFFITPDDKNTDY